MKRSLAIAAFAIVIIGLGSFGPTPGSFIPAFLSPLSGSFIGAPSRAASPSGTTWFPDTNSPSFLLISDIHLYAAGDQSPAITKNADSGKDLWDSAKKKIRSVLSGRAGFGKPKFIICLGDLPWHAKDSSPMPDVMKNAGKVLADLRVLASTAKVPLFFVPGNNDSEDGDYGPFSDRLFSEDPGGAGHWPVIGGSPLDTTAWSLGCYSAAPLRRSGGLLVLIMNTNVFTPRYGRMTGRDRQTADADKELKWLGNQLRSAAAQHRRVLIAMHVPPGKDGYLRADPNRETCTGKFKDLWDPSVRVQGFPDRQTLPNKQTLPGGQTISAQNAFLDLMSVYQHSVVGIVAGHTHFDGIRMLKDRKKDSASADEGISSLLISVPGITPGHGNNPGFKLIRYDPVNFQWNDFITFYNDFYPAQEVKSWGDLSFSFKKVFHAGTKGSMLDQLRQMPVDSLRMNVNSIYSLYNGDGVGNGNCIDTTLFVHYQP